MIIFKYRFKISNKILLANKRLENRKKIKIFKNYQKRLMNLK